MRRIGIIGLVMSILFAQLNIPILANSIGDQEQLIWPNEGAIHITKEAKQVEGTRNQWEITLQVEGKDKEIQEPVDVILVLDKSGSMDKKTNNKISCNNKEQGHIHDTNCIVSATSGNRLTRAQLVELASKGFVKELLGSSSNVQLGIVDFSTNASVKVQPTREQSTLYKKIEEVLKNPDGGTNVQQGLMKAKQALAGSSNKGVVILLSDGEPTYHKCSQRYSGNKNHKCNEAASKVQGPGSRMDDHTKKATLEAAQELKDLGYTVYTIGSGVGKDSTAEKILKQCASDANKHYFNAADTAEALKGIMNTIVGEIKNAATEASIIDPMGAKFDLIGSDSDVVASQGSIEYNQTKDTLYWEIGNIREGAPATIKYKVRIQDDVKTGVSYETNGNTILDYKDVYGRVSQKSSAKGDFTIPKVSIGAGNIRVIYYLAEEREGTWVPVNKVGQQVSEPRFAHILKNELHTANGKEDLAYGSYTIDLDEVLQSEGSDYTYVKDVIQDEDLTTTININTPTRTVYYPYTKIETSLECNCSTVLAHFIKQVKNLKDSQLTSDLIEKELVESIVYKIQFGETDFEKELAKLELRKVLEVFGNERLVNNQKEKIEELIKTPDVNKAREYITITSSGTQGVKLVIEKLGIPVGNKSLESLYIQLNHSHGVQGEGTSNTSGLRVMIEKLLKEKAITNLEPYRNKPAKLTINVQAKANGNNKEKTCDITLDINGEKFEFLGKSHEYVYELLENKKPGNEGIGDIKKILETHGFEKDGSGNIYSIELREEVQNLKPCVCDCICAKLPEGFKDGYVLLDGIKVQSTEQYLKECVCRYESLIYLKGDQIELGIADTNYIMPQNSAQFGYSIKINREVEQMEHKIDLSQLISADIEGVEILSYNMDPENIQVRITDVKNEKKNIIRREVDYLVAIEEDGKILLEFKNNMPSGEYFITIQIKNKFAPGVEYSRYKKEYLAQGKKGQVAVEVIYKVKKSIKEDKDEASFVDKQIQDEVILDYRPLPNVS